MKNSLKILPLVLGMTITHAPSAIAQKTTDKTAKVIMQSKHAPSQAAKKAIRNAYSVGSDGFYKDVNKEDQAFVSILQKNPEECKRLFEKFIKSKQEPSQKYWQNAMDSLFTTNKL